MFALTYPWIIIVCFCAAIIVALKKHYWIAGGLVVVGFIPPSVLSKCVPVVGDGREIGETTSVEGGVTGLSV